MENKVKPSKLFYAIPLIIFIIGTFISIIYMLKIIDNSKTFLTKINNEGSTSVVFKQPDTYYIMILDKKRGEYIPSISRFYSSIDLINYGNVRFEMYNPLDFEYINLDLIFVDEEYHYENYTAIMKFEIKTPGTYTIRSNANGDIDELTIAIANKNEYYKKSDIIYNLAIFLITIILTNISFLFIAIKRNNYLCKEHIKNLPIYR